MHHAESNDTTLSCCVITVILLPLLSDAHAPVIPRWNLELWSVFSVAVSQQPSTHLRSKERLLSSLFSPSARGNIAQQPLSHLLHPVPLTLRPLGALLIAAGYQCNRPIRHVCLFSLLCCSAPVLYQACSKLVSTLRRLCAHHRTHKPPSESTADCLLSVVHSL